MRTKCILVCGAGGFIGGHAVKRYLEQGHEVWGIDLKEHEYVDLRKLGCKFLVGDLRDYETVKEIMLAAVPDEVIQLAADMGGAGFIFTKENDADIMHNSATINLNVLDVIVKQGLNPKIFYSSSACIYPEENQLDPQNPNCEESSAYPANPDSEYGWEKLFSERLYLSYARNKKLNVRIARFHNIFGPEGTWMGGREKAPAALCRKVAMSDGRIEVWGDGEQTRSFLYIDECLEGVDRLMKSSFVGPVNIGSDEMITINGLARMIADIAGKKIEIDHIPGPLGVRGRSSDNRLIQKELKWAPQQPLRVGLEKTYRWIESQIKK
jgi:nucleoside-diphosphate-sugar epimerase